MIFTERMIAVRKDRSEINEPIVVYRGDYEVEVRFIITNINFKFVDDTNLIESKNAAYGQLAILTPYGGDIFSEVAECNEDAVTFVLTKAMLDQLEEVGLYSFQIRLFDHNKESRVSIPPVEFGIEVREPITSEDRDNSVNNAIVGYSIAKVVDPNTEVIEPTFDGEGNYNKTNWGTGDRISQGKLNRMEDAIEQINRNEINDRNALNKQMTSNFNVLTSQLEHIENNKHYCNVSEFGAIGDGITDDKTAIQNAINYCASSNKELVFDSNKTYLCYSISIPSGIKINGNGATLKKPNLSVGPYNMDASQMKWIRMFTITYSGINDSANTIIENLNFNGNCWEMWSVEDGYSQEQASLLIAHADNANPGRLNLTINNCTFVDNVSDGIHVVQNVKAQITNCRSKDCFRGGLTITGGNSTINVDNFIFESPNTNDGIDIEIDSPGYGGIYSSQINLNNIIMDDDLDVVASNDSIITLNNVIMKGDFIYLGCEGELFVSNSTLRTSNDYSSRLLLNGNGKMKFSNVKFEGANPLNGPCLPIQFFYEEEGSMITFDNCSFYGGTAGIQGGYSSTTKIFFNNCYFDDSIAGEAIGCKDSNVEFAPLELHVSNCTFNNPGYSIKCLSNFEPRSTLYISNINVTNPENTGFFYHLPTVIYDVVLTNGYATKYATGGNPTVYGKRLLFVDDDPNTLDLRGYKNIDIAILKTDRTQKWEYSHNDASSSWKNVWTLIE